MHSNKKKPASQKNNATRKLRLLAAQKSCDAKKLRRKCDRNFVATDPVHRNNIPARCKLGWQSNSSAVHSDRFSDSTALRSDPLCVGASPFINRLATQTTCGAIPLRRKRLTTQVFACLLIRLLACLLGCLPACLLACLLDCSLARLLN